MKVLKGNPMSLDRTRMTRWGVLLFAGLSQWAWCASVRVTAERTSDRPLLSPRQDWMSLGVFNPTAIRMGTRTVLLFRAQDSKHTSRIGFAESVDGVHFSVRPEPVLVPEAEYEKGGGLEDPRVVLIDGIYYLTYTGYDLHSAQLCLATSKDLVHWERKGIILRAYQGSWNTEWTKSGAIVPEKIDGKWWMYYLGTRKDQDGVQRDHMGLASSSDLLHWTDATDQPVLERRPGAFDSRVMEPGPAPYVTPAGILLLYNGADDRLVYGPGWILFDRQDPRRVLARSEKAFLLPTLKWEKTGNVPNVIFLEGAVEDGKGSGQNVIYDPLTVPRDLSLFGYYGAADKYIGRMHIQISVQR